MGLVAAVILLHGCSPVKDSPPTAVVSHPPTRAYLILTADRTVVRENESVEILVTFVNPTGRRVTIPTESFPEGGYDKIEHRLGEEWKGANGDSSLGMEAISINVCPPSSNFLEPGDRKSYRLVWKSSYGGEGTVELTYEFRSGSDFPPIVLRLKTR